MATIPTSNPVPSNAPQDLLFNAEKFDEFVNSLSTTFVDRFGVPRLTLNGVAGSGGVVTTPTAPTAAVDGTAVDHVLQPDGSADVSFEWSWSGTESDINGFEVLLHASASGTAYTPGTTPANELILAVPANKRAMLWHGLSASTYLTMRVRAFRLVTPDVDASGVLRSAWVQPGGAGENPYRPAANVAFSGNLTGTIDGIPVSQAAVWDAAAANFNDRNDRNGAAVVAPTIAADGTAVDHAAHANASVDVSLEWSWAGTEADIDGFQVALRSSASGGAYTIGTSPAQELILAVPANKRAQFWLGLSPTNYLTMGVRAYRIVDQDIDAAGVLYSAWVQPSLAGEAPYQPSSSVAFAGDVTGTVAGIPASDVNVWSAISGINVTTGQIAPGAVTAELAKTATWVPDSIGPGVDLILADPINFTPAVDCVLDLWIMANVESDLSWGSATLMNAACIPAALTAAATDDVTDDDLHAWPSYSSWSSGNPIDGGTHYDWGPYLGPDVLTGDDRKLYTLFHSFSLTAGTAYRIGLASVDGASVGTFYDVQYAGLVRKR